MKNWFASSRVKACTTPPLINVSSLRQERIEGVEKRVRQFARQRMDSQRQSEENTLIGGGVVHCQGMDSQCQSEENTLIGGGVAHCQGMDSQRQSEDSEGTARRDARVEAEMVEEARRRFRN